MTRLNTFNAKIGIKVTSFTFRFRSLQGSTFGHILFEDNTLTADNLFVCFAQVLQQEGQLPLHESVFVSDRVAERLRGRGAGVASVAVNSTIPGRITGRIEYVDWRRFADMLIFKRRQYLPDLCNDLLYSGV